MVFKVWVDGPSECPCLVGELAGGGRELGEALDEAFAGLDGHAVQGLVDVASSSVHHLFDQAPSVGAEFDADGAAVGGGSVAADEFLVGEAVACPCHG